MKIEMESGRESCVVSAMTWQNPIVINALRKAFNIRDEERITSIKIDGTWLQVNIGRTEEELSKVATEAIQFA